MKIDGIKNFVVFQEEQPADGFVSMELDNGDFLHLLAITKPARAVYHINLTCSVHGVWSADVDVMEV